MPDSPMVFDLAGLDRQTGGDRALRFEIVQMFLEDCPMRVGELRAAIERGDAFAIRTIAHTLKGAAGYLSAARVHAAARDLETIGREARLADAAAALERLATAVAELIPELRRIEP